MAKLLFAEKRSQLHLSNSLTLFHYSTCQSLSVSSSFSLSFLSPNDFQISNFPKSPASGGTDDLAQGCHGDYTRLTRNGLRSNACAAVSYQELPLFFGVLLLQFSSSSLQIQVLLWLFEAHLEGEGFKSIICTGMIGLSDQTYQTCRKKLPVGANSTVCLYQRERGGRWGGWEKI